MRSVNAWPAVESPRSGRRAFIMGDLLMGMALVTVLGLLLSSAVGRGRATEQRLADQRSAGRIAEHALLNLQHGQLPPTAPSDVHLAIRPVSGGAAPMGSAWIAVDVTVRGRPATLIGVVPASAAPTTGGNQP